MVCADAQAWQSHQQQQHRMALAQHGRQTSERQLAPGSTTTTTTVVRVQPQSQQTPQQPPPAQLKRWAPNFYTRHFRWMVGWPAVLIVCHLSLNWFLVIRVQKTGFVVRFCAVYYLALVAIMSFAVSTSPS
jgi:hypothetical protein